MKERIKTKMLVEQIIYIFISLGKNKNRSH